MLGLGIQSGKNLVELVGGQPADKATHQVVFQGRQHLHVGRFAQGVPGVVVVDVEQERVDRGHVQPVDPFQRR